MISFRAGISLLLFGAVLVACGDGDDSGSRLGADASTGGADGGGPSVGGSAGSATLVIGDQRWEFDSFLCAFGHEATTSDIYSFSSSSIGTGGGETRVQMQAEIQDPQTQGRYEGEGVLYTVYINDIENFETPAVDFESTTDVDSNLVMAGLAVSGETVITIDGDNITATGLFDDLTTEMDLTQVSGTLTAVCGSGSSR